MIKYGLTSYRWYSMHIRWDCLINHSFILIGFSLTSWFLCDSTQKQKPASKHVISFVQIILIPSHPVIIISLIWCVLSMEEKQWLPILTYLVTPLRMESTISCTCGKHANTRPQRWFSLGLCIFSIAYYMTTYKYSLLLSQYEWENTDHYRSALI